jgi:ATP synthase protein I
VSKDAKHPGRLNDAVARRHRQRQHWQASGERPLARNLAMIGFLGWVVVMPTLLGIFAGRWLDRELHSGVTFTGALLFVGLALGCWFAWKRIHGA